jgi:WD40 repeat protein
MNPDGTAVTRLTNTAIYEHDPAWSPDGRQIAFGRSGSLAEGAGVWVMRADGSDQHLVLSHSSPNSLTWSPDGSRIAFAYTPNSSEIVVMNADGTNPTTLPSPEHDELDPSWSPLGTHIAYVHVECDPDPETCLGPQALEKMAPDGTGRTFIWGGGFEVLSDPDWFPNGERLAFNICDENDFCEIVFVNADGTGAVGGPVDAFDPAVSPDGQRLAYTRQGAIHVDGVSVTSNLDFAPAWQPIPIGYPRPRGASPTYASLVPAYAPCAAPNRTHGAPLSFPSCTPPAGTSTELTVGTPDVNFRSANSIGYVQLTARPGNAATPADEADVRVGSRITDVRRRSDLSDYTGELGLRLPLQITDRNNTGAGPGTVQPTEIGLSIPCTVTSSTNVGATCATVTTIEAVIAGAISEETRTVWELGRIRVDDGGPDGDADTPGNGTFAVQGVFVP